MSRIEIDLEKVEQQDIDEIFDKVSEMEEEPGKIILPENKTDARRWLLAHEKIRAEIDYLKDEYIPFLMEKYIGPVKEKITKYETEQEFIKNSLLGFLKNIEETKINFPDIGTVSEFNPPTKIIYPEEDEEIIKALAEANSPFIATKYAFDKKKISEYYKEKEELPVNGLIIENPLQTVRIRRASSKKEKE